MEKEKYYQPKIEEFHYGFKFEIKEKEIWIKMSFWDGICPSGADREWLNDLICNEEIRVPYLSKEDIESLGFKPWENIENKVSAHIFGYREGFSFVGNSSPYRLYVDYKTNKVAIKEPLSDGQFIFRGIIKNKSELKKLMQMLEIQ